MEGGMVFILGAGASAGAGAPVMSNFFQRAKHLYRRNLFAEYAKDFKIVEDARGILRRAKIKSKLDVDNLEEVYTALEMVEIIGGIDGFPENEARAAQRSLDRLILVTLQESIEFPVIKNTSGNKEVIPTRTYGQLAAEAEAIRQRHPSFPLTFITFNYDIAFDYALTHQGVKYTYCLSDYNNRNNIKFCKLHGSLNWGLDKSRNNHKLINVPLNLSNLQNHSELFDKKSARLRLDQIISDHSNEDVEFPYIVPPTGSKQALHTNLKVVWEAAAKSLSKAEVVVIIGYSFPSSDQFFKNFFALSTIGNSELERIVVIDPNDDAQKNLESILSLDVHKRLERINGTFDDNIVEIAEIFKDYLGEWIT